jgi:HEAT repeat protein
MKSTLISTLAVVVTALAVLTGAAAEDVDKHLQALGDKDPEVRARAAYALGNIGDKSTAVVDKLIDKALDPDATVRRQVVRALLKLDPPVEKTLPTVLKILEEGDRDLIGPAMQTIVEEGEAVVPRLREVLDPENEAYEKAAYWACVVLADIGAKAKDAVPEVKGVLKHDLEEVRMQALITLGEILSGSDQPMPEIVALLKTDPSNAVRYAAAYALGQIGPDSEGTAALEETLESKDAFLELTAAWALASNDPDNAEMLKRTVDLIVEAFKSDDVNLRRAAARMAVEFDVPLDVVAPMLIESLQDPDPRLVRNAIETLVDLGPKALKHVDELLQHRELRFYALPLISRLGPKAAPAVPALIAEIKKIAAAKEPQTEEEEAQAEEDAVFRREAVFALAEIGPAAADAVPLLKDSLKSKDLDAVTSASYALGMIGPDARDAVPTLIENLRHEKPIVQFASISALFRILPGDPRVVPRARGTLLKLLESDEAEVRFAAVMALGKMGRAAKSTLPQLRKRLKDESEMVREEAAKAIKQIET